MQAVAAEFSGYRRKTPLLFGEESLNSLFGFIHSRTGFAYRVILAG
jgi:hypothetical protein